MAVSAPTQVRALAKAVATAFAAANLTDEERHPPRIDITDLPWACPALVTDLQLDGVPLQDYFDAPLETDARRLERFWIEANRMLWFEPSRVLKNGVYSNLGQAMPKVRVGQRALRFSAPIGAPSLIDQTAAVTLALEVAHAAYTSLAVANVTSTDDDYIVEAIDGTKFGVAGGRPLLSSQFEFDARGMVPELLRAPRGEVLYHCMYDQIASVRSILHSHPKKFPYNFEALDCALQALRYLSLGGHCPELNAQMVMRPADVQRAREHERLITDALEVLAADIPDRRRLETIYATLVPTVLSDSGFRKQIFSSRDFPFALALGKIDEIRERLHELYKSKIPQSLQRPL